MVSQCLGLRLLLTCGFAIPEDVVFIIHTADYGSPPVPLGPHPSQWEREMGEANGPMKPDMVIGKGSKGERNLTMCPV